MGEGKGGAERRRRSLVNRCGVSPGRMKKSIGYCAGAGAGVMIEGGNELEGN